jgi:hypothetical protein
MWDEGGKGQKIVAAKRELESEAWIATSETKTLVQKHGVTFDERYVLN